MSRAVVISPAASLIDEVHRHLALSGRDYSDNIVVFPGKRPAHFLRKAIAESDGKGFIPPRIYSIDVFVEFLCSSLQPGRGRNLEDLDAAYLLFKVHRELPDRIGGDKFDEFEAFLPLGMRIFSEFEEATMNGADRAKIEASMSGVSFRGIHLLGPLYGRFYEEVGRLGYWTRAQRYAIASDRFTLETLGRHDRVILAGFFALTQVERALFERLMELDQVTAVFQDGPGLEEKIRWLPLVPERKEDEASGPRLFCYSAPDTHGEIFGLASKLKEGLDEGVQFDRRTVIVVPDPSAMPVLVHHALTLLPDEYNISIGYPHARTPLLGYIATLTDLVSARVGGKYRSVEYLRFIQHVYTKNITLKKRTDCTRVLANLIEDEIHRGRLRPFFTLEEIEGSRELCDRALRILGDAKLSADDLRSHLKSIHDRTIRRLEGVTTPGECAGELIDVLSYISSHSTARRHPFFRLYAESLMNSLANIRTSIAADEAGRSPEAVFRIMRETLREGSVSLPGTPLRGVQVLGLLETRNLRFDRVFFLNANDEMIPGSGNRYSLIPNLVRTELGLPTQREHEQVSEYYFSQLVSGAQEVHLFFTEDHARGASRYIERFLWQKEKDAGVLKRDDLIASVSYRTRLTHSHPDPIPKPAEISSTLNNMQFSATAIDTYLQCGLRFYYRYILRLEEREEVEADIDRAELGRFVHRVLADLYAPFVGKAVTADELGERNLDDLINSAFSEMFGGEEIGNRYLMKIQTRKQLTDYIHRYEMPRLRNVPIIILGVETDLEVEKRGIRFRGRLDRIEQRNKEVVITDYKTTGNPAKLRVRFGKLDPADRSSWGDAIGSLQLPIYSLLYSAANGSDPSGIRPSYLTLGKSDLTKEIEMPLYDPGVDPALLYPQLEGIMFDLLGEIADEKTPFQPAADLDANCPFCPYVDFCGTRWVKRRFD